MKPSLSNSTGGLHKVKIIGFAGHRTLQNPDAVAKAIRAELADLRAKGWELIAMSSIAIGADTIFAREALHAGIKWIVFLPKDDEFFQKDFTPQQWNEANALRKLAADKRDLHGPDLDQAYVDCGKATVDESDCLFAVWDDQPARGDGGTAQVVDYARKLGRKVTHFCVNGDQVEKKKPTKGAPAESEAEDILKLMRPPITLPPAPQRLTDHFSLSDAKATEIAPNFRRNTLGMARRHLAATFVAGLALSIEANQPLVSPWVFWVLAIVKFSCVFSALLLLRSLRETRAHEAWLQYRLEAEYCRSMLATWHCHHFIDPVSFQDEKNLKGVAQAALLLRLEDAKVSVDIDDFRANYAHYRIMEQLGYFRREWKKAHGKAKPLRDRYQYYTYSAVAFSLLVLIYWFSVVFFGEYHFTSSWWARCKDAGMSVIEIYPLLFPALASYVIARMGIDEIDRRLGRFADLKEKMRVALIDLYYCGSWESLSKSVERTEKILFNEVREWYSISWFSPNE